MVQINFALREVNCKVVYYGPGRSGKTTNLEKIHEKAPKGSIGEMVSIATETDRTLFFDFLPLDLGTVAGMNTKFQLYTVPGQVYYNATRKLVLQGADGVVFVADSQRRMHDENIESLQNLIDNLKETGIDIDEIPIVIQYNKRDLDDLESVDELNAYLNRWKAPFFEAVAVKGDGVFATLKGLASKVINQLNNEHGYSAGSEKAAQQTVPVHPSPAPISSIPTAPVMPPEAPTALVPSVTAIPTPLGSPPLPKSPPAPAVKPAPAPTVPHAPPPAPPKPAPARQPVTAEASAPRAHAPAPGISFLADGKTVDVSDAHVSARSTLDIPSDVAEIDDPEPLAPPPAHRPSPARPAPPASTIKGSAAAMAAAPQASAPKKQQEEPQENAIKREMDRRRDEVRRKEQEEIERIRRNARKPIRREGMHPVIYIVAAVIALAVAFIVFQLFFTGAQ